MIEYSGWVPTIAGQLSFSLIGVGDKGCFVANGEKADCDIPHRSVVVARHRVAKDVIAPVRWWHPQRKAQYILVADTVAGSRPVIKDEKVETQHDEISSLAGYVYVIPYHEDKHDRKLAKSMYKKVVSLLSRYRHGDDIYAVKGNIADIISESEINNVTLKECRFVLSRTGQVKISVPEDAPEALAKQVYYFVKDCAHRHYHHHEYSDNILPLVRSIDGDDETWRRRTLWHLAKSVLESRRKNCLEDYKSAKGILAYADAFQSTLGRVCWDHAAFEFKAMQYSAYYDFQHTRASIDALIEENENKGDELRTKVSIFTSVSIGVLALWLTSIQVIDKSCLALGKSNECVKIPWFYAYLVNFNVRYPYVLIALFVMSLYWIFSKQISRNYFVKRSFFYFRDISDDLAATLSKFRLFMISERRDDYSAWIVATIWLAIGAIMAVSVPFVWIIALSRGS